MQFALYCLCGGIGVTVDFLTYYILVNSGVWYQAANVVGYLSGTLISFFLNRLITFSVRDQVFKRLLRFLSVAAIGFTVSAALLWFLVEQIELNSSISKLLTLPIVVLLQFMLNRSITFKIERNHDIAERRE